MLAFLQNRHLKILGGQTISITHLFAQLAYVCACIYNQLKIKTIEML